jgi:hypothetical protein
MYSRHVEEQYQLLDNTTASFVVFIGAAIFHDVLEKTFGAYSEGSGQMISPWKSWRLNSTPKLKYSARERIALK